MRRGVAEAIWHARHRAAFGALLVDQPAMVNVLADLALESEAATATALRLARAYDEDDTAFRRFGTAIAKYWVCKRATPHAAEALECLGGNGYVEESPLPRLLRDAPLNGIWEGSGNVIALDVLRALSREPDGPGARSSRSARWRAAGTPRSTRTSTRCPPTLDPWTARRAVEELAVAFQASLLVRFAPAFVADAFCAARLGGGGGRVYGTLPAGRGRGGDRRPRALRGRLTTPSGRARSRARRRGARRGLPSRDRQAQRRARRTAPAPAASSARPAPRAPGARKSSITHGPPNGAVDFGDDDRADDPPIARRRARCSRAPARARRAAAGQERAAVLAGDQARRRAPAGGRPGRPAASSAAATIDRAQAESGRYRGPLAQVVRVHVRVPSGDAAGGDQRAAQRLRPGHAHAAQLGQDHGQRALDRHLELEQVGDRRGRRARAGAEARQRDAVGVGRACAARSGPDRGRWAWLTFSPPGALVDCRSHDAPRAARGRPRRGRHGPDLRQPARR